MYDWPIGLSTGSFHDVSIFDSLNMIRQGGFGMIEVCTSRGHLDFHNTDAVKAASHRLRELDIEAYSMHAPFSDDIDITSYDEGVREHSKQDLLRAVEAAGILKVRYLVLHPGPEKGGFDKSEHLDRCRSAVNVLNEVARRCREVGVGLALENMLPHLFAGPIQNLLWLLGNLESAGVGICLDIGHAQLAGAMPSVIDKLSGHLWMVHLNDNRGQGDDHLPPGDGNVDWQAVVEHLSRTPFTGGMILEIAGQDDKRAVLESARRGRLYLRDLSRRLAVEVQQRP